MKQRPKKRWILCGSFLAAFLAVVLDLFLIGEPIAGEQVSYTVSADGQRLELQADAIDSAVALRGWKFRREDSTLYISARKVLVSPLFDEGHYETSVDAEGIETIILGGKTIWPEDGQME